MSVLAFWIYIGGVFACANQKVGFFKRAGWPIYLGELIAERVYVQTNQEKGHAE